LKINRGFFGSFSPADAAFSGVFTAEVVIPRSDFDRLGLGDGEGAGAIPKCFRWCHTAFGIGGTRWSLSLPHDGDASVYFAAHQDALAFVARWSAGASQQGTAAATQPGSSTAASAFAPA
jgi:hypothetical protein